MTVEKTSSSHAACVLDCGGYDAAFQYACSLLNDTVQTIANGLPNHSPSPWGEGRGEGELNTKIMTRCRLARCSRAASAFFTFAFLIFLWATGSSLIKPFPTYPRLSQQFLEKKDCLNSVADLRAFAPLREVDFGTLLNPNVLDRTLLNAPPGGAFLSLNIAYYRLISPIQDPPGGDPFFPSFRTYFT